MIHKCPLLQGYKYSITICFLLVHGIEMYVIMKGMQKT